MALLWLGLALAACAKTTPTPVKIVVATDATYPPMEMLDASGEIIGFDVELMKAAATAVGATVEFKNVAWDDLFTGLSEGEYDAVISSVTITDDRRKTMDFSIPYYTEGQVLVIPSATTGVNTIEDLRGQSAGVLRGSSAAEVLATLAEQYDITVVPYDGTEMFKALLDGQVGAVVADATSAETYVAKYQGQLRMATQLAVKEEFGVAVRKGDKEMLDIINAGLQAVIESGEAVALEAKWIK
jgi:polar amino acid transport system substrate-binding protein